VKLALYTPNGNVVVLDDKERSRQHEESEEAGPVAGIRGSEHVHDLSAESDSECCTTRREHEAQRHSDTDSIGKPRLIIGRGCK